MTTMIAELYDALKEAGASDEKAREAAKTLAERETRFDQLDRKIDALDNKIEKQISETKGDLERQISETKSDLEKQISETKGELEKRIDAVGTDLVVVRAELAMLKWMIGGIGFGMILLVIRSFWPA